MDDEPLAPVLDPLPEFPLPEADLGVVTELADVVVPDELATVDKTGLPESVEVPPVPDVPRLP